MTVKVKVWALPILEQKYDSIQTYTHTAKHAILNITHTPCWLAGWLPALSVCCPSTRKAGAGGQANSCFKLINFVFITGKDSNNNKQRKRERETGSFCFLILCFHLPLFLRYLPICAFVVLHLKRFSRATNYYLNFDMHLRVAACRDASLRGQQMGLFK